MKLYSFFKYFRTAAICRFNLLYQRAIPLLLLTFAYASSFAEPSYQVFIIPTDDPAVAVSITDGGIITGYVEQDSKKLAFIFEEDLEFLGTLGGDMSSPSTINNLRQIVGSSTRGDSSTHAFIWDAESEIVDLTPLHPGNSHATDISNRGVVVGLIIPESAFEWSQDSGLQIVEDDREGYGIAYLGIADNGIKLVKSSGPDSSVGTSYFLSSIPGQNDFHVASENLGTGQVKISGRINNEGVAAGWKKSRDGFSTATFYADPNTRKLTNVLKSDPRLGSPAIVPVDINDNNWLLSKNRLFIPDIGMKRARLISLELIEESSDFRNEIGTLSASALNNDGDIVGSIILDGKKAAVVLINQNRELQPTPAVAQYRRDFTNPQSSGWHYQWNADSPIGNSDAYVDMQWDRWKYDSDGMPGLPDSSGLAYGHFSAKGGHPGLGETQGEKNDRYVIAGYTVDQTGEYKISDSHLLHTGCDHNNGGDIEVYVDDNLINKYSFENGGVTHFDGNIGLIDSGSTIYVAVGPDTSDSCDGFEWDYAIRLLRNFSDNQSPIIFNPGLQTSETGDTINLVLNARDPDGDLLSFEATGLPDGLSINNESGVISGDISQLPSSIGTHNVLVTVRDDRNGSNTIRFDWVIFKTNTVAQYSTDFDSQPANGWRYQWNSKEPIGQSDAYIDMKWDRWKYDSDGLPGLPDSSALAYGHLSASGGHPGLGTSAGEAFAHYVIAGFEVGQSGEYRITDSQIIRNGCEYGDGEVVDIYVDDNFIASFNLNRAVESVASFDVNLGEINVGSVIYAAVGPKNFDDCGGFDWDYTIEQIITSSP